MAVSIPATAIEQNDKTQTLDSQATVGYSRTWKDATYANLKSAADEIRKGDVYDTDFVVSGYELARTPGGGGRLTIHFVPKDATSGTGSEATTLPKKEVWSLKAVRNDISIMSYCGPNTNNPNRVNIEMWEKETDPDLANINRYRKPDGTDDGLTSAELALVDKKRKGIEAVIRFYPLLTRRRTYSSFPPGCLDALGFIDAPPVPTANANSNNNNNSNTNATEVKLPGGLAGKVAQYQWLKVDDSSDEDANGDWTRTESWMGIKLTDDPNQTPWDADLYGQNRWTVPYAHGGNGS